VNHIRRAKPLSTADSHYDPTGDAHDFQIDHASRRVSPDGHEVKLTRKECVLLRTMSVVEVNVLTHRHLLQTVWGPEYGAETEYFRTFVNQLLGKLEQDPSRPNRILTDHGVGYRLLLD
jgi:two-component system KDP operon response regulator KdpE